MKVYGLFIENCVDGGCPVTNLLKLYTNKETAELVAESLNKKYPEIDNYAADWKVKQARDSSIHEEIKSGEYELKEIAGCLEFAFEKFYVEEIDVSESRSHNKRNDMLDVYPYVLKLRANNGRLG